jgi:hypothetical protein
MALTSTDLQAIGQLLDTKLDQRFASMEQQLDDKLSQQLKPICDRLDIIELKQNLTSKKLDDLQLDMKIAERDIRRDIHTLTDEMDTVIEILKQHDLIPQ